MLTTIGIDRVCEAAYLDKLIHNADQHKLVLVETDAVADYGDEKIHIPNHSVMFLPPEENPVIDASNVRTVYFTLKFWCRSLTPEMLYNDIHNIPQPVMTDDIGGVLRCLNPFYRRDTHPLGIMTPPEIVYQQISDRVDNIARQLSNKPDWCWSCRARSNLSQIMELVIDFDSGIDCPGASLAKRIAAYIHGHLGDKITLVSIASDLHANERELNRAFQATYGTSIHQYIIDCRMRQARHDLAMTSLSVDELSRAIAYSSPSAFVAAFSSRYGQSPLVYRSSCVSTRKALFGSSKPC